MTGTVAGIGNIGLDWIERPDGRTYSRIGGTCGNILCVMAFLGWTAVPISRLRPSPMAERIERLFDAAAIDTRWLRLKPEDNAPGVVCSSTVNGRPRKGGHVFLTTCPNCGAGLPAPPRWTSGTLDVLKNALEDVNPDVVVMDRCNKALARMVVELGRQGRAVAMFPQRVNPNSAWRDVARVSSLMCVSGSQVSSAQIDTLPLPDNGPRVEVQTRGRQGLMWRRAWPDRRDDWISHDAFVVREMVDATGSGDWVAATTLAQMGGRQSAASEADETELATCLQTAIAAASYGCQFGGARGSMERGGIPKDDPIGFFRGIVASQQLAEARNGAWQPAEPPVPCPSCPMKGSWEPA